MQRLKTVLCIVTTSFGLLSLSVQADDWHKQPRGFNTYLSSVVEIQKQGRDDDLVVLQGRLTNYLGKNNYEFTDLKGDSIEVELDDDLDWSRVHRDQLITIRGKVEKNMFTMQVEAKYYSILTDLHNSHAGNTKPAVATVRTVVASTTSPIERTNDTSVANAPQVTRGLGQVLSARQEQSQHLSPITTDESTSNLSVAQKSRVEQGTEPSQESNAVISTTIADASSQEQKAVVPQIVSQATTVETQANNIASQTMATAPKTVVKDAQTVTRDAQVARAPRSNAVLSLEEFVEQAQKEAKGQENVKQTLAQQKLQVQDMRRGYINLVPSEQTSSTFSADTLANEVPLDPMFKAAYNKLSHAVLGTEPEFSNHTKYSAFVTSNTEHLPSHEAAQALVANGHSVKPSLDVSNSLRKNEQDQAFNYTYNLERESSDNNAPLTPSISYGEDNSNLPMLIDSTVTEIQSKLRKLQQE